jgi:hypothetical protein
MVTKYCESLQSIDKEYLLCYILASLKGEKGRKLMDGNWVVAEKNEYFQIVCFKSRK